MTDEKTAKNNDVELPVKKRKRFRMTKNFWLVVLSAALIGSIVYIVYWEKEHHDTPAVSVTSTYEDPAVDEDYYLPNDFDVDFDEVDYATYFNNILDSRNSELIGNNSYQLFVENTAPAEVTIIIDFRLTDPYIENDLSETYTREQLRNLAKNYYEVVSDKLTKLKTIIMVDDTTGIKEVVNVKEISGW